MFLTTIFNRVRLIKVNKGLRRTYANHRNPFVRTWQTIVDDVRPDKRVVYPEHADIVIIGGGFIGSSIAYWLKDRAGVGLSVVVLEKDLSYKEAQNNVLLGTLSQHYSLPENIYLSQFSAEFFRNVKKHLNSDVDIQYYPHGRLLLASEKYAEHLEKNVTMLQEHGTKNVLLTPEEIHKRYPWINTSDIKLGCISTECEGVFNSNKFLTALVNKTQELGGIYINGEVVGFDMQAQRDVLMEGMEAGTYEKISAITYRAPDNELYSLKCAVCVLAAGVQSNSIAEMAKIGTSKGLLTVPLPMKKRKYNVFSIKSNSQVFPSHLDTPFVMDTSGLWFRRNQLENKFLCGHIPSLDVNNEIPLEDELNNLIKPTLVNRFPGLASAEIDFVHSEVYDYTTYDDTGVVGPHAYHGTLLFATGFGPLGCQHAPGIARAIAELIIDGNFTTIDLTRMGFDRFLTDQPLVEFNVY